MNRIGPIAVVVGLVIAAVSALADPLGVGEGGFGWRQGVGVGVGIVVAIAGIVLSARAARTS